MLLTVLIWFFNIALGSLSLVWLLLLFFCSADLERMRAEYGASASFFSIPSTGNAPIWLQEETWNWRFWSYAVAVIWVILLLIRNWIS